MSIRIAALGIAILLFLGLSSIAPASAQSSLPEGSPVTAVTDPAPANTTGAVPEQQDDSALPEGLTAIFAALGLYVVTMFTMAIGTEIAVDVFKLAVGLKSKPSARESMQKYNDLIPGSLESLGASVEQQQRLQSHINNLNNLLAPVVQVEDILDNLQKGHLGEAVRNILALAEASPPPDKDTAVKMVRDELHQAVDKFTGAVGFGAFFSALILDKLDMALDRAASEDPREVLKQGILVLHGETSQIVTSWARTQLDNLSDRSRAGLHQRYRDDFRPHVAAFGLGNDTLTAIDDWFAKFEEQLENQSSEQVDIYLRSLSQLLEGVERQREMIRSPFLKVWSEIVSLPVIGPIAGGIEKFWLRLIGRSEERNQQKPQTEIKDITVAARMVMELDQRHKDAATSRVRLLRTLSVIVGILLAYLLRIDSADLLAGLLPDSTVNFLTTAMIPANDYRFLFFNINIPYGITAGIILTGLAASAGSSFWHEQLSRLQAVKEVSEAAYSTIRTVQSAVADRDGKG